MQVILLEKFLNLGASGQVVSVKNGYARNFLIPQNIARRATKEAITEFQEKRLELEKNIAEKLLAAQEQAKKLNGLVIKILKKSRANGKLFGSVTSTDLAITLEKQGFSINKHQIQVPKNFLKLIGDYVVSIFLYKHIVAKITVSIQNEMI